MMSPATEPCIRVKMTPHERSSTDSLPRDAFWAPLLHQENSRHRSIDECEHRLVSTIGRALRHSMARAVLDDVGPVRGWFGSYDLLTEAIRDLRHEREHVPAELLARLAHQQAQVTQQLLATAYGRRLLELSSAIDTVAFIPRITGYGSLDLALYTSSYEQLATIFDGSFEYFRVFLEGFLPQALGDVFNDTFAASLQYEIEIPDSVQRSFIRASDAVRAVPQQLPENGNGQVQTLQPTARDRAHHIWRIANYSLVVPVLLALLVLYYGQRQISDMRRDTAAATHVIMDHQCDLLKEDRARMSEMHDLLKAALLDARQESGTTKPTSVPKNR